MKNRLSPQLSYLQKTLDMYRNNRNQDNYRINKRNYNYRQEAQEEENITRNNRFGQYPNQRMKKHNNGNIRPKQKPDKLIEDLRNLGKPLKPPQVETRQDYIKDQAKNQSGSIKQNCPRGGKIYQPQYQQTKKQLDQKIQQYKKQKEKANSLKSEKLSNVNSNRNSDELDWDTECNKIRQSPLKKQEISSWSFSVDIPPLQIKEVKEINEIKEVNYKKEVQQIEEKDEKQVKQVDQFKGINEENVQKMDQLEKEEEQKEEKITILKQVIKIDQNSNEIALNETKEVIIIKNSAYSKKEEINQQQKVFTELINAINLHQQKNEIDKEEQIIKVVEQEQNNPQKAKLNKQLIIKLAQSQKKVKIFVTFQVFQNIQSFTIKEIDLSQLDISIKLDSDGRPKIKQSHKITAEELGKYIKFTKTSHYFPKIGRFQQQAEHFVDVAENREFISDQTNQIEFQFCQVKVADDLSLTEDNKNNKSLIGVKMVSLLCMICGNKNQVIVLQNDMTVVCSCKGNDCSQKMFGRIAKVRMEVVDA